MEREGILRDLFANILAKAGYQVHTAGNEEEAGAALRAAAGSSDLPRLIIRDLPADPDAAAKVIQRFREQAPAARILFCGGKEPSLSPPAFPDGVVGWIAKPCKENQLLNTVQKLLAGDPFQDNDDENQTVMLKRRPL